MTSGNGADQESLDYTFKYNPPIDPADAERALKEAKAILGEVGVEFLLSSGTCLGAIRDNAFIPWDDDIDLISVLGANGLTEVLVDTAVAAFRAHGYFVYEIQGPNKSFSMIKNYVRTGWESYHIVDGAALVYPKARIPAEFLTQPKEIEFVGERFLVPNPPEEYLRLKYGERWKEPRRSGEYEMDVVEKIPSVDVVGSPCWVKVLDTDGRAVAGADVALVGGGHSQADVVGYAAVVLPEADFYALIIKYPGHEQVLYMEELAPGKSYVYRADRIAAMASEVDGPVGTLGQVLVPE